MNIRKTGWGVVGLPQGRAGVFLVGICWPLNWVLPGLRSAYLFFPLWLGYILTVDALVQRRSGISLLLDRDGTSRDCSWRRHLPGGCSS